MLSISHRQPSPFGLVVLWGSRKEPSAVSLWSGRSLKSMYEPSAVSLWSDRPVRSMYEPSPFGVIVLWGQCTPGTSLWAVRQRCPG